MKYISAAVVAAAVLASSAVIADVPRGREPVSINVSTAGLDLTTQRGRNALRVRMDKEIAVACNPGGRLNADFSPDSSVGAKWPPTHAPLCCGLPQRHARALTPRSNDHGYFAADLI